MHSVCGCSQEWKGKQGVNGHNWNGLVCLCNYGMFVIILTSQTLVFRLHIIYEVRCLYMQAMGYMVGV